MQFKNNGVYTWYDTEGKHTRGVLKSFTDITLTFYIPSQGTELVTVPKKDFLNGNPTLES